MASMVSWLFCSSWAGVWGGQGPQRPPGSAFLHPLHGALPWAPLEGKAARGPSKRACYGFIRNRARPLGPGFSLSLSVSLSDCPLLPFSKCLLQKSTPKYRWKTLMQTAAPSSWRTHHHPSCHHLLLPNPTPSLSRDLPQEPKGHLLCFSWAFRGTRPPVCLGRLRPEWGKQLAQGHSLT